MSHSQEWVGWHLGECDQKPPPHWIFWFPGVRKRPESPVRLVEAERGKLMAQGGQ